MPNSIPSLYPNVNWSIQANKTAKPTKGRLAKKKETKTKKGAIHNLKELLDSKKGSKRHVS